MVDATNAFGPLVIRNDVEEAVVATLDLWFPTYLAEMERRYDREPGVLKKPSWEVSNAFPEITSSVVPPFGIVISPGTSREPEQNGDGTIDFWWDIRVSIVVDAGNRAASNLLSSIYAAAAMWILVQKQSLGGVASRTRVLQEDDTEVPADYANAGWASQVAFEVLTEAVATRYGGPAEPDLDPEPLGQFETAEVLTDRRRP